MDPVPTPETHDPSNLLTTATSAVQTPAGDLAPPALFPQYAAPDPIPKYLRRIYCCTAGLLAIQRTNDPGFTVYPVFAGQYIDGWIVKVGGSSSGTTCNWIAEL